MSSNCNKVYLWVEPASHDKKSFASTVDHTSICVEFENGLRYVFSYNEHGLSSSPIVNVPDLKGKILLGDTNKTLPEIIEQTQKMLKGRFSKYSLMSNNCNHFCNELSKYLCGKSIPDTYTGQSLITVAAVGTVIGGGIAISAAVVGTVGLIGSIILGALFRR